MLDGVAHVRFRGGGIILPVDGPYDRQCLIEEIGHRVRKKGALDVVLSHERWRVRPMDGHCVECGFPLRTGGCSTRRNHEPWCISCAFTAGDGAVSDGRRGRGRQS
jgi:hypothetical protein